MAVPAGGVKPTRDPRPQYAPMERARTELIAPHADAPREFVRRVEATVPFTEDQMVRPRDADDVHRKFAHDALSSG